MPRSGKSTILNRLVDTYESKVGMVTNEILQAGSRVGFEAVTSVGGKALLASINTVSDFKVSKYFVFPESLDNILPSISDAFGDGDLLYLDEIGQMQLASESFRQLVLTYLNSGSIFLMTLSKVYEDEFSRTIKNREDVIIVELTENNREESFAYVAQLLKKIAKAKRYASERKRWRIDGDSAVLQSDHGVQYMADIKNCPVCKCEFFQKYGICSHIIALDEVLKN